MKTIRKSHSLFLILMLITCSTKSQPIYEAIKVGNLNMVKEMISKNKELVHYKDSNQRTPLHLAARKGNFGIIKYLVENDADVNALDKDKSTALHSIAYRGDEEALKYLLEHGANVNIQNSQLATPLTMALFNKQRKLINLLLKAGTNLNQKDIFNSVPLHTAIRRGYISEAKEMIEKGADINIKGYNGYSPLHIAVENHQMELLRILLSMGASINEVEDGGDTPLHRAVAFGNIEATQLLLNYSPDLNAKNKFGRTPLHQAAVSGYSNIAKLLITKGASVNEKDNEGKTAIDLAKEHHNISAINLLRPLANTPSYDSETVERFETLEKPLPNGLMSIWYLGNSGWAVKVKNKLLVFDYWNYGIKNDDPSISNGKLVAKEIKDLDTYIFITHVHADHYDSTIFKLETECPKIKYIFGWKASDNPNFYYFTKNQENQKIDELEVFAINDNNSAAFLVLTDGFAIYHGGDYLGHSSYTKDFCYLSNEKKNIDVGFYDLGEVYRHLRTPCIEILNPKVVFPMHFGGNEYKGIEYIQQLKANFSRSMFLNPMDRGDNFIIRQN